MKRLKLFMIIILLLLSFKLHKTDYVNLKEVRIEEIKNLEFSHDLLIEYMNLNDLLFSDVPLRQFILESGWFKDEIFIENNNIAGMKLPKKRETTAIGTSLGHAKYNHWTDSVDDYILLLEYYKNKGYNMDNFYNFLKKINYASSKDYEIKLKRINIKLIYDITNTKNTSIAGGS